jgi:hypothetical protein
VMRKLTATLSKTLGRDKPVVLGTRPKSAL